MICESSFISRDCKACAPFGLTPIIVCGPRCILGITLFCTIVSKRYSLSCILTSGRRSLPSCNRYLSPFWPPVQWLVRAKCVFTWYFWETEFLWKYLRPKRTSYQLLDVMPWDALVKMDRFFLKTFERLAAEESVRLYKCQWIFFTEPLSSLLNMWASVPHSRVMF